MKFILKSGFYLNDHFVNRATAKIGLNACSETIAIEEDGA